MLISAEKSLQVSQQFWESFPERIREENVKPYTLPDPLKTFDGKEIRTSILPSAGRRFCNFIRINCMDTSPLPRSSFTGN